MGLGKKHTHTLQEVGGAVGGGAESKVALDQCELHEEKLSVYCWTCSKCICHQDCQIKIMSHRHLNSARFQTQTEGCL